MKLMLMKNGCFDLALHSPFRMARGDAASSEPVQAMMRKVIALFDEYQSKENAKHVIRSMKENARQGFWNGSMAPLGYRLMDAEKRGAKIKKKLAVDPVEAETVRLVFNLYLHGDGKSGALGVKEIVKRLSHPQRQDLRRR
jgi:site-specific DNA recombinase